MFLLYVLYLTGKVCARFQPPPTVAHITSKLNQALILSVKKFHKSTCTCMFTAAVF